MPGCANQRAFANENDKLRAEDRKVEQAVGDLQEQLRLRESELRATREQADTTGEPDAGIDPPRLAGIVLGLDSGPIDLDGDKRYDALRVYVRPIDQHSRQITAEATVRIRLIVVTDQGEPVVALDQRYDVEQFHAAYRSGLTGTHYTLKASLPDDPPNQATLHVTLTDAVTGKRFTAEKAVTLVRGSE